MNFTHLDLEVKNRILAAHEIVSSQIDLFHQLLGKVAVYIKEDHSRVTDADLIISNNIEQALLSKFPEDNMCSEESKQKEFELKSGFSWVLDPIDGTDNFYSGIPLCGISLALLKEGYPIYGLIYDASTRSFLQGGKGIGVWSGKEFLKLSEREFNPLSLVAFHGPLKKESMSIFKSFLEGAAKIRSLGSAVLSLAYLASGKIDGYMDFQLKVWDFAAGYAILEGLGIQFTFRSPPIFPMHRFDINHSPASFYTGTSSFCRFIETKVLNNS